MARAMILGAGLGTRLRPLTLHLPKPLVPVGDRAVLTHITDSLSAHGHTSAVVNTHWLAERFDEYRTRSGFPLTLVHEPRIRGGAGGVWGARQLLEAPLIVWNGDMLLSDPPLPALIASIEGGADVCLAVAPCPGGGAAGQGGTVGLDQHGRVVRLRGEQFGQETRSGNFVGLLALSQAALGELPEWGCLIGDVALPRLRRGLGIATVPCGGGVWDIGSAANYAAANRDWLAQRGASNWVHPGASIAPGVTLSGCVIGAGATVAGQGDVRQSVLWPGSVAHAPLSRSIVGPEFSIAWNAE